VGSSISWRKFELPDDLKFSACLKSLRSLLQVESLQKKQKKFPPKVAEGTEIRRKSFSCFIRIN
jgi:hypothetical protein